MILNTVVERVTSVLHNSCKENLEKSERKVEDLDSVIKHLAFENHQLKAIYDYRIMELESQIIDLSRKLHEKAENQIDTINLSVDNGVITS